MSNKNFGTTTKKKNKKNNTEPMIRKVPFCQGERERERERESNDVRRESFRLMMLFEVLKDTIMLFRKIVNRETERDRQRMDAEEE